jgi:hypothetical protein
MARYYIMDMPAHNDQILAVMARTHFPGTRALALTVMVRLFQCAGHCDVSMCSVQGAPCDVQGALCDVQCAVCSVQCAVTCCAGHADVQCTAHCAMSMHSVL